ncbi:MAG: endo alpha-1,4 polygalactosaminidase [Chloroflexi bacterium]|nr:endo alpha-1,4 polygalactosaminidase [Chloroflexota bacterium]
MWRGVKRLLAVGVSLMLSTAALAQAVTPEAPIIWQPEPGVTWQWQLTGEIDTSYDVAMYDIDLFDAPQAVIDELHAAGRIVICYFSAGSHEDWRPDSGDFPAAVLGEPLDDWPGERWLDIRQLDALQPIMAARLDLAVAKGCDGVEPDNVDGYTQASGFRSTYADQLAYNRWLAEAAHERGLSIGLKNDLNQIADLVDAFDWALNEQCFQYGECELLLPFIDAGKAVFGVEYREEGLDPADYCPAALRYGFSWLTKMYDLGAEPPQACESD